MSEAMSDTTVLSEPNTRATIMVDETGQVTSVVVKPLGDVTETQRANLASAFHPSAQLDTLGGFTYSPSASEPLSPDDAYNLLFRFAHQTGRWIQVVTYGEVKSTPPPPKIGKIGGRRRRADGPAPEGYIPDLGGGPEASSCDT